MLSDDAKRAVAPLLVAMVRRHLDEERAASSPAGSASPTSSQGASGDLSKDAA